MFDPTSRVPNKFDLRAIFSVWVSWLLGRIRAIATLGGRSNLWLPLGISVFCLVIIATLWIGLTYESKTSQDAAIGQARRDVSNLTTAFRENTARTVGAIDLLMMTIIAEHLTHPDEFRIPSWVNNSILPQGMDSHVTLIGPDGFSRASTLDFDGQIDLSDRPHFRYHIDPAASQPYISAPVIGRISGKWSIQFTRRITRADGSFGGVVVVTVDPYYFSRFFDDVDLGKNGVVVLAGLDGIVRARRAMSNQDIGQDISKTGLYQNLRVANAGTEIVRAKVDGITRVYGYELLPDYPLVVSLGISLDDVLATPLREERTRLFIGGILSAIIIGLSGLLIHEINRRRSRADEMILQQKLKLDVALNNMSQGLLMFDSKGQLVLWNKRYVQMYGLSDDLVTRGCVAETLPANSETYCCELVSKIAREGPVSRSIGLDDGRTIHIENRPLKDGGWVSTHSDVTKERRAAEALSTALRKAESAEQEALAAHARLRDAFEVVPEGVALFDAEDRYVLWNRRYAELYAESACDFKVGLSFEDVLRAGLARGQYQEAVGREEEWLAERLARHAVRESIHEQHLLGDRWVRVQERRTADGGSIGVRIDITDLKQREASFRLLFDSHPLPMFVVDLDSLRFLAVNDAAVAHYGYVRDQFLRLTVLDIRPAELREGFADRFRGFGEFQADEGWSHQKADGTVFEAAVYSRRLMYEGRVARLASVIDITERRRAERERDRNREFLDLIIDNVPITILVKEATDRKYVLLNQAGEKLWGMPRAQVVGKTAYELFPRTRADLIDAHDEQTLRSDRPFVLGEHSSYVRADESRIVTSKTFAIRDADGKPQYLVSVVEDITERRRAENERDRNRQFLDQIIDNVPMPIVVKDAGERRVILVNRATEKLWGISRAQALGKTVRDLFSQAQADTIEAADEEVLRSDVPVFVEAHQNYAGVDDARIITSTKSAIRDRDGTPQYLISVVEDVTERKAMEQQLYQAQKMEAVGNLTGGLAHDFNNLLTIIIGNLDLLQDDVVGNNAARQKVDTILQASLRGADLTGQMLAFSRRQALQPKLLEINQLVGHTTRLLTRTLGGDIQVDVRCSSDLWPVLVDETQLQTALLNIALNARDAMPSGGRLIIATYNAHVESADAAPHPEVAPGDYVVIDISDTGAGMPPDILARIFEPFFTTKSPGKGTGLGLSMVYGFVRQSGGYVRAESESGVGATFKLYLPRAQATKMSPTAPACDGNAEQAKFAARGEVILAVDDNLDVRRAVVVQLEALGYQVMEADGAVTALKVLGSGERIDLLFTDVVMPGGMNGKELANRARAMRPGLKVLFTSGFPGAPSGNAAELGAGDALLNKPYRREQLVAALHQVLR
jgi:PAS domain S-box-containing protein